MIIYSEEWLILLLCRLKGSVAQRSFWFAIPAAFAALVFVQIDMQWPEARYTMGMDGLDKSTLWNASVFLLSALMIFRTNRAMARFWEGTGLLHQMRGEWFDAVSCCVTFSRSAKFKKQDEVNDFRHTLVRLMSVCHGAALCEIAGVSSDQVETIDTFGLSNETLLHLKKCSDYDFNRVEVILHMIQTLITSAHEEGCVAIAPPILSRVYQTLSRGFVNLLNAKKIADTRFPFPYAQLITLLLFLNCGLIPVIVSSFLQNRVLAPLFTFIPVFGLFSLNFIGIELENPFGDDDNDLPLGHFQKEMNRCLLMLLADDSDIVPCLSQKRAKADFKQLKDDEMRGTTHRITHWRETRESTKLNSGTTSIEDAFRVAMEEVDNEPTEMMASSSQQTLNGLDNGVSEASSALLEMREPPTPGTPITPLHRNGFLQVPVALDQIGEHSHSDLNGGTEARGAQPPSLVKNVDEFNRCLQEWTQMLESQLHDLRSRFSEMDAMATGEAKSIPI